MNQSSFSDLEYSVKKKRTRKDVFLKQMDEVLPWALLLKPLKRHYPKAGKRDRFLFDLPPKEKSKS